MKNRIQLLAGFCALVLSVTACKKDDGDSASKRDLLTSGKWRLTASTTQITLPGLPAQPTDNYASMEACEKDNLYQFQTSGAWVVEEGASACDPGTPQSVTAGSWQLLQNDTKFRLTVATESLTGGMSVPVTGLGDSLTLEGDVLELNASSLRIKATGNFAYPGLPVPIPYEINQSYVK